jgi:hypothetical protein
MKPPHASFFSKVNGKLTKIEGPYETQWLDIVDSYRWEQEQKKRKIGTNINIDTVKKDILCKVDKFRKGIFDRNLYRQTF